MTGITKSQVFAAADALQQEGVNPTQAKIAEKIGGSYTTIGPHLREWRQLRSAGGSMPNTPVPEGLKSAIEGFAASLWRSMEEESAERARAAMSLARLKETAAAQDYQEALSEIKRLEAKVEALQMRADSLEQQKSRWPVDQARLESQVEQLQATLKVEREDRKTAESLATTLRAKLSGFEPSTEGKKGK